MLVVRFWEIDCPAPLGPLLRTVMARVLGLMERALQGASRLLMCFYKSHYEFLLKVKRRVPSWTMDSLFFSSKTSLKSKQWQSCNPVPSRRAHEALWVKPGQWFPNRLVQSKSFVLEKKMMTRNLPLPLPSWKTTSLHGLVTRMSSKFRRKLPASHIAWQVDESSTWIRNQTAPIPLSNYWTGEIIGWYGFIPGCWGGRCRSCDDLWFQNSTSP